MDLLVQMEARVQSGPRDQRVQEETGAHQVHLAPMVLLDLQDHQGPAPLTARYSLSHSGSTPVRGMISQMFRFHPTLIPKVLELC